MKKRRLTLEEKQSLVDEIGLMRKQGMQLLDACEALHITTGAYHRWHKEFRQRPATRNNAPSAEPVSEKPKGMLPHFCPKCGCNLLPVQVALAL